jgi:regulator of protease activity HflC (stomatin/prohibitin superfamily)
MADNLDACCFPLLIAGIAIGTPIFFTYVRVIMQFQRGIVFRLGRYVGTRKPGLTLLMPFIDTLRIVDMRIKTLDIPKQEVLTKDNISVLVNCVVYYRVVRPDVAILKVQDYSNAIFQHGQAAMRDIIGSVELDTILSEREKVAEHIHNIVSKETIEWGIEITSINMQDIELPHDMKKAMARQAQAEREKRATVIISMGEVEASHKLSQAANVIASSPGALHLRTLQSLSSIASDKTNNITFILPLEGKMPGGGKSNEGHVPEPLVSFKKK